MSNLKEKVLIIALIAFGVVMLTIGLLFGVGYWKTDDSAARWLYLAVGLSGSSYIFIRTYRALRH